MIAVNPAARADASLLGNSGPYRAVRLQVFNWGTFSNIHDIPISAKGFLFVGASGSGKSTLIDAMATLLFPNPNYNAAAREGEKRRGDRTLLSYVRGAWATQTEIDPSGATRSVVQHLRRNATFSAIALTFADRFKNLTTLMLAAAIRKSANDESSVRRRWFIIEGGYDFNARDFEGFARSGLDWRWLKNALPPAEDFETFASYSDAFCRLFGIREKTALKLLAKAQSAKNLGDLNAFLRNFMLEEPRTFEIARTLVEEFNDLREAHDAVVAERRKAETERLRAQWERTKTHRYTRPSGGEQGRDGYMDADYRSQNGTVIRMVSRDVFDVGCYSYPKRVEGTNGVMDRTDWTEDEKNLAQWLSKFGPFHGIRM